METTPSPREEILNRIRVILSRPDLPFPPVDAPAVTNEERLVVTHAEGDVWALARRFGEELEKLFGTYEILESPVEARLAFISRIQGWAAAEEAAQRAQVGDGPGTPDPGMGPGSIAAGWHCRDANRCGVAAGGADRSAQPREP
ncbi:MAG: hypothetical protein IPK16_14395 [Anaerolineales bacterium]|nr:hypothetical protein [Anaerolineales bacterium]